MRGERSDHGKARRAVLRGALLLGVISLIGAPGVFPCPALGGSPRDEQAALNDLALPAAERDGMRDTLALMGEAGFSPDTREALLDMARELTAAGISTVDLASKVREGVAKKVNGERVMAVLAERVSRLKEARALVLGLVSEGTVFLDQQMAFQIMADYLARGIPAQDLRRRVAKRSFEDFPALGNVVR